MAHQTVIECTEQTARTVEQQTQEVLGENDQHRTNKVQETKAKYNVIILVIKINQLVQEAEVTGNK